jgi:hypothetical protein
MLSQAYVEIVMLRQADLLKEAERNRLAVEALRIRGANNPGRTQPGRTLAWLVRWMPGGLRRPVATRT